MRTRIAIVGRALAALGLLAGALIVAAGPATALPPYRCGTITGGTAGVTGHITDVRVGRNTTFDRFVVEFSNAGVPTYRVIPKSSSVFTLEGSGKQVTLLGTAGIKLVLDHATGQGSFSGPYDRRPRFPQLREARQLGDFEAVTSWGLGIAHQSCKRVFTLSSPSRLVIDVPH